MKKNLIRLIFILLFNQTLLLYAQVEVSTFAGSGALGTNDGIGSMATFGKPAGIAVDLYGNIYVADTDNHSIRKITPEGIVTTLAGSRNGGSLNGMGAAASFNNPEDVAVDTSGNVYVADYGNNSVRKITPAGLVTTLYSGYMLHYPTGIAVDLSGNVYVADKGNNVIRKITPSGFLTTLAGSSYYDYGHADGTGTNASFSSPAGVAVDDSGNVYVADAVNHLIRKITQEGVVTTLAGSGFYGNVDGIGKAASFNYPTGVDVDTSGNIYVADSGNSLIRKITPSGVVTTLAGSGSSGYKNGIGTDASFAYSTNLAIDTLGNIYVADIGNNVIRKIVALSTTTATKISAAVTLDIKLYPIPASNQLTLALTLKNESGVRFELTNSEGAIVATTEIIYGAGYIELSLSVQSLPAGLYVANTYSGNEVSCQKIVITR